MFLLETKMSANHIYETPMMWWYRYSYELGGKKFCTTDCLEKFERYVIANPVKARQMYVANRNSYPRVGERYVALLKITQKEKEHSGTHLIFEDLY